VKEPPPAFSAADVDYHCPPDLIAQHPAVPRGADRMLVLDRATGARTHAQFEAFPDLINPGDALVVNTSKVIAARLHGARDNGRPAEILLVHPEPDGTWLAMVHPGGKLRAGRLVRLGADTTAEIVGVVGGGLRRVRFTGPLDAAGIMRAHGAVPLPPYIHRAPDATDGERYQTVYAKVDGSVAAPTAGLHFTPAILDRIRARDVALVELVLHVGPGTFKPVEVDDPARHAMHAEWYDVPVASAETLNRVKGHGGKIWAVGTTAARTLETVTTPDGMIHPGTGWADLFIYPPYRFRAVDHLLTNFHLPRSTLLMLVAAFAGRDAIMGAYAEAVAHAYRLYSYGDAMAVI